MRSSPSTVSARRLSRRTLSRAARLRDVVLGALGRLAPQLAPARLFGDLVEKFPRLEMVVPHVESALLGGLADALAVSVHAGDHDVATIGGREAAVTTHDLEARGEALDVPLPRAGQGLVEVVDVEDELPFGCSEHAEVRQMRVAATLHPYSGMRCVREVGSHDRGRAAVERERRDEHAPVANGHELGHPLLGLLLEDRDRIWTIRSRFEARMRRSGRVAARVATAGDAFVDTQPLPAPRRRERRIRPCLRRRLPIRHAAMFARSGSSVPSG